MKKEYKYIIYEKKTKKNIFEITLQEDRIKMVKLIFVLLLPEEYEKRDLLLKIFNSKFGRETLEEMLIKQGDKSERDFDKYFMIDTINTEDNFTYNLYNKDNNELLFSFKSNNKISDEEFKTGIQIFLGYLDSKKDTSDDDKQKMFNEIFKNRKILLNMYDELKENIEENFNTRFIFEIINNNK